MLSVWQLSRKLDGSRYCPSWMRWVILRYRRWYVWRHIIAPLDAAMEQGAGCYIHYWTADTPGESLLNWFDSTIAAPPPIGPLAHTTMTVLAGTEQELGPAIDQDLPIDGDRLLVRWSGLIPTWWSEGRDAIAAAIPPDHQGLVTVTQSVAGAWQQWVRQQGIGNDSVY